MVLKEVLVVQVIGLYVQFALLTNSFHNIKRASKIIVKP